MKIASRVFSALSSLQLAVVVLVTLTLALIAATFLESLYDTPTAKYWVYQSVWFYGLLGLLGINIFCVAMSRYPWKPKHGPFLLAHAGILILLYGSWLTDRHGLDGSLRLLEGAAGSMVEMADHQLLLSSEGKVSAVPVRWTPPHTRFKPMRVAEHGIEVDRLISHADANYSFVPNPAEAKDRFPAIKLKLTGGPMRASQEYWLWSGDPSWASVQAGPAQLTLFAREGSHSKMIAQAGAQGPVLQLYPRDGGLAYEAKGSDGKIKRGFVPRPLGAEIDPGWKGDVRLSVLEWIPHAMSHAEYVPSLVQYGNQAPPPAIHVKAGSGGEGAEIWLGLGDRAVLTYGGKEVGIGYYPRRVMLPFGIQLDRFLIEHYQGTRDPAKYSSLVRVVEGDRTGEQVEISMNEPLKHQGYTFYQASYEDAQPRPTVSILSVNRDPGRWIKYLGSLLIVLGSVWLFAAKTRRSRAASAAAAAWLGVLLGGGLLQPAFASEGATQAAPRKGWSFSTLSELPVQAGGRVKPLDSYARELMLFVTGSRFYEGWNAVELLLSWISFPRDWETRAFIHIGNADVKKQLGLDIKRSRFSPQELVNDSHLVQYAQGLAQKAPPDPKDLRADPREVELRRVMDRVSAFRSIVSGEAWPVVPVPSPDAWRSLAGASEYGAAGTRIEEGFRELVLAYKGGAFEPFQAASSKARQAVEAQVDSLDRGRISAEFLYSRSHPFLFAWILYLLAGVLWLFPGTRIGRVAAVLTGLGFFLHVAGMAVRSYVSGRPPVSNMYESVVWVSFGILVFAWILHWMQKQKLVLIVACFLSALSLIAADSAPAVMDPGIHPLVPVLRSNLWLTVHVLTITMSYAAFALAFGMGNIALWHYLKRKPEAAKVSNLNQLAYRCIQFGVVLVAAGTILGGVWADYSWGRFWGWDPKEVWALIVLLAYLVILHGRYAGWVGQFGFAMWNVLSFLTVIMAWYGVNFVLGVGLHSYGFSTGGRGVVAAFTLVQLAYVGWVAVMRRANLRRAV